MLFLKRSIKSSVAPAFTKLIPRVKVVTYETNLFHG